MTRILLLRAAHLVATAALAVTAAGQTAGPTAWLDPVDPSAGLCSPEWSSPFGAEPGLGPSGIGAFSFSHQVYAAVVYDDGSGPALFVGGDFRFVEGAPADHLAKWDGSAWSDVGGGVNGRVRALTVADFLSGPELIVGGLFDDAGGTPCANLASWDGSGWTALAATADERVTSLYTLEGAPIISDFVVVGGAFTSIGGTAANRIALYTGTSFLPFGAGFDNQVLCITEHDGSILAGGIFNASAGSTIDTLARWTGSGWEQYGGPTGPPGPSSTIADIVSFDDGSGPALYASGLSILPGSFGSFGRYRDGVGWDAPGGGIGASVTSGLEIHDDGGGAALYVGGLSMSTATLSGERVLRWDGASWDALGSGFDAASVRTLASYDDGGGADLYALGDFWSAGGTAAHGAARWDGLAWSAVGDATGITDSPYALRSGAVGGTPALYVGGHGDRLFAPGVPDVGGLLAFVDGAWQALGDLDGGPSPHVEDMAVFDDGSGPRLYVGGAFESVDGVPAMNIACWDGATWSGLGLGANGAVTSLHVWDDGGGPALFIGGSFDMIDGSPANGIVSWDGSTYDSLDGGIGPISPPVFSTPAAVRDMEVYDDGSGEALYIAGRFGTGTPAPSAPGKGIARWDGADWTPVGAGLGLFSGAGEGDALAVYDDGGGKRLFVGGAFDAAGGLPASHFAAYDGAWSIPAGGSFNARVRALEVYDDGSGAFLGSTSLHIGGDFSLIGASPAARIARWDGVAFTTVGGGLLETGYGVRALEVHDFDDGQGPRLVVGGGFANVSPLAPDAGSHIAVWGGCWSGVSAWTDLGFALSGVSGDPLLVGGGSLSLGSVNTLDLSNAAGGALAGLFLSFTSTPTPFAGGTLVPVPWLDPVILTLPPAGELGLTYTVTECLPAGVTLYAQWVIADGASVGGYALSNAVLGVTP